MIAGEDVVMNSKAQQRLEILRKMLARERDRVRYEDIAVPPVDPAQNAVMVNYLRSHYGVDHDAELAAHGNDMPYWLVRVEQLLYEDLEDYCRDSDAESQVLQRVALGYFPRLAVNAFAEGLQSGANEYVIGVNSGLLTVCAMLCQALLLEVDGQHDKAEKSYELALTLYNAASHNEMARALSGSTLLGDDKMSIQSGALGSVILRFVGLHELGHVVLGHTERAGMCLLPETGLVRYGMSQSLGVAGVHDLEFAADRYAIDRMLQQSGSPEQMWNNTLFISAFFRLLEHVELLHGKPNCPHHPPPGERISALENRVREDKGAPPTDGPVWATDTLLKWRESKYDA